MAVVLRAMVSLIQFVVAAISLHMHLASAEIGVNYGMKADNLPSPKDVIRLYQKENIKLLRLFDPNTEVLNALRGSGIKVSLGVRNEDVQNLALDQNAAIEWVKTYVLPYATEVNIGWITLGNEMVPGPDAELIPMAMTNILNDLHGAGLRGIKVTTVINSQVLGISYPPSSGAFSSQSQDVMNGIISYLRDTNNPILVNIYPYFAFASDPSDIRLDYALFNGAQPVADGSYRYYSLFEAMIDSFYAAFEKAGLPDVELVVSETGWPNGGQEPYTSKENARLYNERLINKMRQKGTPRRPSNIMDIFIFAMFNEDQKASGVEQNWGLHYPNMSPVYPLKF